MLDTILGFKQKMGAVYINGRRHPVTWVKVEPCVVTQIKNEEKDGYLAVQIGTGSKRIKNISKPIQGHLRITQNSKVKSQNLAPRYFREIRVKEDSGLKVGVEVKLRDVLKAGDFVTVIGTSKGKGFAGVVKRWRFAGGPKTHGQSDRERAPGSIGNRTSPGRVFKGKRMAGRMGSDRVTVKNLNIIDIDEKNNLIAITGAVPGVVRGLLLVKKTGEGGEKIEKTEQVEQVELVEKDEKEEKNEGTEKVELTEFVGDTKDGQEEVKKADLVEEVESVSTKTVTGEQVDKVDKKQRDKAAK